MIAMEIRLVVSHNYCKHICCDAADTPTRHKFAPLPYFSRNPQPCVPLPQLPALQDPSQRPLYPHRWHRWHRWMQLQLLMKMKMMAQLDRRCSVVQSPAPWHHHSSRRQQHYNQHRHRHQ
jgi:hypothetical protein